jgi:hypothetical protein
MPSLVFLSPYLHHLKVKLCHSWKRPLSLPASLPPIISRKLRAGKGRAVARAGRGSRYHVSANLTSNPGGPLQK